MTGQERRKHPRFNFKGAPIMVRKDVSNTGVSLNISFGGLGLILETPLETGMEATLEMFHQSVLIGGTIRHRSRLGKDLYQMGLSFKELEPGLVHGMMAVWGYRHSAAARYV